MWKQKSLIALFLLKCCVLPVWGEGIVLVQDGVPNARIIVSTAASKQAREAAGILQHYLERISSAKLSMVTEGEEPVGPRVLVGRSKTVTALGVDVPTGFTNHLDEEGFVMKTVGTDLVLAGNEERDYRGTVFAVYEFLELLGCRWYYPGEYGELIPKRETIVVPPMDRLERPDFRIRNINYAGWMPISAEDQAAFNVWFDRNKLCRLSVSMPGDGSVHRLAPPETYFESHPHMYSINRKGERWEGMLCMTDPEAHQRSVDAIKQYFRENPKVHSFGFAPGDGYSPRCFCPNCERLYTGFGGKGIGEPSISDVWFRFANSIAEEVYKDFPDRWVLTNGYANRVRLPESLPQLSPNLGVQIATIHICTFHRTGDPRCWERQVYQQLLERWTDAVEPVILYDYDPGSAVDNMPFTALHALRADLPRFKELGVWGFWTHAANSWLVTHLNYYVRAKLMWDTDIDVDALVTEFCERFYGPAAMPVEEYLWSLEGALETSDIHTAWGDVIPWGVVLGPIARRLDRMIAEAEAVASDTEYAPRVHFLRLAHDHMNAYLAMERAQADANFAGAAEWARKMIALRDRSEAIRTGMLPHTAEFARDFRTTIEWHRTLYTELAAMAGGTEGDRIMNLPRIWEFKKDPRDMGVLHQWYLPDTEEGWEPIDTTLYWEAQGHVDGSGWGYRGKAWYRTQIEVPLDAADRPLTLTLGGVYYDEDYEQGVWVWVNGRLITPERCRLHDMGGLNALKPIHVDVTGDIRAGETNTVAVLVHTEPPARFPRGGLHRRAFLWSPKDGSQPG